MAEAVNPDMVVLARESRSMTQAELAQAIGISQAKVSKYENGLLDVAPEDLHAIAKATRYTEGFFFEQDKIYGLGSSMLFNRKLKTVAVSTQKQVQANVNVLRMQVARLLRGAEVEAASRFDRLDIDAFNGDIPEIAARVRAAWKLPTGPIRDLTRAVESAGGIVLMCKFAAEGIDAAHLWVPDMPPLFFMNATVPGDRYRFNLAHEIGHAIMHQFPSGDIESEAHAFGRELLMPAREIRSQLEGLTLERAARLKPHWKVSMQALIVHAYALDCITERQYRRLFQSLSAHGYRKNEPIPVPLERPTIMPQLIEIHRRTLGYSDHDLSRMLFTSDAEFYDLQGVQAPSTLTVHEDTLNFNAFRSKLG